MKDIVEWLKAQLDADEQIARAATPGPWVREWAFSTHFVTPEGASTTAAGNVSRLKPRQRADAEHIALQDPAHVLRTIAAHRAILAAYETAIVSRDVAEGTVLAGAMRLSLRLREEAVKAVASIYSDRPGFDPAWKVNP